MPACLGADACHPPNHEDGTSRSRVHSTISLHHVTSMMQRGRGGPCPLVTTVCPVGTWLRRFRQPRLAELRYRREMHSDGVELTVELMRHTGIAVGSSGATCRDVSIAALLIIVLRARRATRNSELMTSTFWPLRPRQCSSPLDAVFSPGPVLVQRQRGVHTVNPSAHLDTSPAEYWEDRPTSDTRASLIPS